MVKPRSNNFLAIFLGRKYANPFLFSLLLVSFFLLVKESSVQAVSARSEFTEYQVKAAFLYNFPKFVDWPAQSFNDVSKTFIYGVLGKDPFGKFLDALEEKEVQGRKIVVKRYRNVNEIDQCQVLFISYTDEKQVRKITDSLKERGILTVGDGIHFADWGGMVGLFTEQNKIRFNINLSATKKAGLQISSKLLKLAENVIQ